MKKTKLISYVIIKCKTLIFPEPFPFLRFTLLLLGDLFSWVNLDRNDLFDELKKNYNTKQMKGKIKSFANHRFCVQNQLNRYNVTVI